MRYNYNVLLASNIPNIQWESRTGKTYYSLNPDEKAEANREILAMLAAEKDTKDT